MTKPDPKDGTILNFNSPEEQEAVEVVFNNAITPLAEACPRPMYCAHTGLHIVCSLIHHTKMTIHLRFVPSTSALDIMSGHYPVRGCNWSRRADLCV